MLRKHHNAGFTLVEVLVAIVIVGLVLTAVAAVFSSSVKNSSQADYRQTASRYAQEAIEIFRQHRNSVGWNTFYGAYNNGVYCINTSNNNRVKNSDNDCKEVTYMIKDSSVSFERLVTVTKVPSSPGSPANMKLDVEVIWKDGSEDRNVEVTQILYDY